jgi:hypothetical protein
VTPEPDRFFASIDVSSAGFQSYREAVERNDLRGAGVALADATHRPITRELVEYVNAELGVASDLTAPQIWAAANGHPWPEQVGAAD